MQAIIEEFSTFLLDNKSIVVLSGAGVSTGSGIPDYRDRNGDWKNAEPIQFADFVRSRDYRKRYWARSYVGWRRFSKAKPNGAHHAVAQLESTGKLDTLITQNVDGLHSDAGSRRVINLHGELSKVRCLDCETIQPRSEHQQRMQDANPDWLSEAVRYKPDGDAELSKGAEHDFQVPDCPACSGVVKPHVVMFGEAVPKDRVGDAMAAVDRADGLLVMGSSLMVFSGFRFARRAAELKKPIAIINQGRTRADDIASVKVDDDCGRALSAALKSFTLS